MRFPLPTLRPSLPTRLLAARLALFAVLVAALVPGVSRLLQPAGLQAWAVLCQSAPPGPGGALSDPAQPPEQPSPPGGHDHGDACALCTLAHTTPVLGGALLPPVAVIAYTPPAPPVPVVVRPGVAQSRAPSARGPPLVRLMSATRLRTA